MLRLFQLNHISYCAKAQFPSIFRNACNSLAIVLILPVWAQARTAPKRNLEVSCGSTEFLTHAAYSADKNGRGNAPERNRRLWQGRQKLQKINYGAGGLWGS